MLNRRILRVKAFKVLYAYAENPDLSARGKFNPTEEDLHPNLRFVENGISALLEKDPDFQRLIEKKKFSWEQQDSFLHSLYETLKTREYYQTYMAAEFEDSDALGAILEDASIYWADELPYVLNTCIGSMYEMARSGRWSFPPLYQSDILSARGKTGVESDRDFVRALVTATYGRLKEYDALIAGSVSKWDRDRLYTTDIVLIAMGLAEAETFPGIPVRVTINEYVEISKYYSTPKSHGFVNGLLDRLIKERMASGIIKKNV